MDIRIHSVQTLLMNVRPKVVYTPDLLDITTMNTIHWIRFGNVALQAMKDVDNIGGTITAASGAIFTAGRDINLPTTTQSSTNKVGYNSFAQTRIDRKAGLYFCGSAGVLNASAWRDINLTAAQIGNAGIGPCAVTTLSAAQNINLGTVTTANSQDIRWSGVNQLRQSASQDVSSQIRADGDLTLNAGQDLTVKGSNVLSDNRTALTAGGSVAVLAAQNTSQQSNFTQKTESGLLSSGGIGVSIGTRMQSSEQKFEQSGVTLALSSGLMSNLQSATKVVINRWWQYAPSPAWP